MIASKLFPAVFYTYDKLFSFFLTIRISVKDKRNRSLKIIQLCCKSSENY